RIAHDGAAGRDLTAGVRIATRHAATDRGGPGPVVDSGARRGAPVVAGVDVADARPLTCCQRAGAGVVGAAHFVAPAVARPGVVAAAAARDRRGGAPAVIHVARGRRPARWPPHGAAAG